MKRTVRVLACFLALLIGFLLAVPVYADGFDMDKAISQFRSNSLNTFTLEVGEKTQLPMVAWTDVTYYVSNVDVVSLSENGDVTAKAEGTAYIAIVASPTMYNVYCYRVEEVTAPKDTSDDEEKGSLLNAFSAFSDTSSNSNSLFSSVFGAFGSVFTVVAILVGLGVLLVVLKHVLQWRGRQKGRQLDRAMCALKERPCGETAEAAVREFSRVNRLVRFAMSLGGDSTGVHFDYWRQVFNGIVIPSDNISDTTKRALKDVLLRFGTRDLRMVKTNHVFDRHRHIAKEQDMMHREMRFFEDDANMFAEELDGEEAARAFGEGGEESVWHNLQTLATRPDCDVYRNVRIRNAGTTSEIDAVVVAENGGVFLLEIKSFGGKRGTDHYKHITFDTLKEDPSNQIVRHQLDFIAYFKELNLAECITNVLVFSWPHKDERRIVDRKTFSHMPCEVLSVEQLLSYLTTQTKHSLSAETRQAIAAKLVRVSGKKIVH